MPVILSAAHAKEGANNRVRPRNQFRPSGPVYSVCIQQQASQHLTGRPASLRKLRRTVALDGTVSHCVHKVCREGILAPRLDLRIPYPSGLSINWVDFAVFLEFFDLTEVGVVNDQ